MSKQSDIEQILPDNITGLITPKILRQSFGILDIDNMGGQGPKGDKGMKGDTGLPGAQGSRGHPGQDSTVQGPQGPTGIDGTIGVDGAKGDKGDKGDIGPKGDKGDDGSGGSAGAIDGIFYENDQTVIKNYTITAGKNAMSAGPVAIAPSIIVTVPPGSSWTIV